MAIGSTQNIWLSWSSGKDSAYSLHCLQNSQDFSVVKLVTTINEEYDRVAMHSTRRQLLEAQADRLGIDLQLVSIPKTCDNDTYERAFLAGISSMPETDTRHIAFGDLFLEDIKAYRENLLCGTEFTPVFPLWQRDTRSLAADIVLSGFKAYITCIDPRKLPTSFAGRPYDERFLRDLPDTIDPCGENGEFHSFVYDAPNFSSPIDCEVGEVVERDGFIFADVLLQ